MDRGYTGNQWTLGGGNNVSVQQLQTWSKADYHDSEGGAISIAYWCKGFNKELLFYMVNGMQRKYFSVFQYQVKYIHNNIVNPYRVGIIQYAKHVHDIHDIYKFIPPHLKTVNEYDQSYWNIRNNLLYDDEIRATTKYALPTFIQD